VRHPPARRAVRTGLSSATGGRAVAGASRAAAVPAAIRSGVDNLLLQSFIRRRGVGRWLAHQALFWGVILAALVTFPLTFGWVRFGAGEGPADYVAYVAGLPVGSFDALSLVGWLTFHVLDVSAVLVLAGCGWYIVRRLRGREGGAAGLSGFHMVPLVVLVAISLTGLALTFSTEFLGGRFYRGIALTHMSVVGVGLVLVPFGKLFHPFQRPVGAGMELARSVGSPSSCRACGGPLAVAGPVEDLQATMAELGMGFGGVVELCTACKRIERGAAYRMHVKGGYR
ncbi:MAG: MFS transporter, partial [Actinomycetota bacterium]